MIIRAVARGDRGRDDADHGADETARARQSSKGKHARMQDFVAAMESVSVSSVLFIRRPVHGAGSKPAIRAFLLSIAVAGAVLAGLACYRYVFTGFFRYPIYRFTAVARRNATGPPGNHSIGGFGVATDGCRTLHRVAAVTEEGPTLTVHYHQPVSMSGWWVQTSNACTDLDPVSYWVHGSHDGEAWSVVGGSRQAVPYFEPQFSAQPQPGRMPLDRNSTYVAYRRRTPALTVQVWLFGCLYFTFVPLFLAVVRAAYGRLDNAGLVGGGLLLTALAGVTCGICQLELVGGGEVSAITSFVLASMFGIIGGTLLLRQQHLLAAGIVALASAVGTRSLLFEVLQQMPWWWPEPLQMMLWGCLALCLLAIAIRFHILWASRHMVAGDKRHYDALWEGVREREAEAIEQLTEVCERLQREAGGGKLRHLYSPKIVAMLHNSEQRGGSMRKARRKVPVLDVDQIFAQASLLHPSLLCKVQEWAWSSGGMFATKNGGLVRWADARDDPEVLAGIKWGQIKSEKRAIEKVIRCYEEDVSRLVDVCRQTIVFATVGELAECLEGMGQDEDVVVERVKNRLRVEESGAESAGFRNVSVNLRVRTEDARSLGVDTHVCEVQLLLADFAKLQKTQGHKRYVRFRNERGQ